MPEKERTRAALSRPVIRAQAWEEDAAAAGSAALNMQAMIRDPILGVNYASAKTGTQSYSAGTLTQR